MTSPQGTILIVDQDASVIRSYTRHLEGCGYEVLSAQDGRTAVDLIAVRSPDLIISDLRVPTMEGHGFFRHIEKRWPEIPIIVTATTDKVAEMAAFLGKGASDYLMKPLGNMTLLSHAVARAMREIKLAQQNQAYKERLAQRNAPHPDKLKTTNRYLTELNHRLTEVVASSKRLSSCATIESFGARLLQEFSHHLDASGGSLYIAGQKGLRLVHCLDGGHAPHLISYPLEKSSPFGVALRKKEPVLIGDIHHERALRPSGFEGYNNGSCVIFPLKNQEGKSFGLVSLHGKKSPPFVYQDREVGGLLASYSSETLQTVRAKEGLAKSEEKYRLAALTASDLISEWSPDTDSVVWLGNIDAVIGTVPENRPTTMAAWLSLIHPDDRERMAATYRTLAHGATTTATDYRVRHLAHGWRHFRERTTTIKAKGGGSKALLAYNDITQEKNTDEERGKLELEMRQAQKLENLSMIAGGIAHDFSDILMAILGHADNALEELGENPGAKKSLDNIFMEGERAMELAQQLLLYSGKGEEESRIINVNHLVSDTMRLIDVSLSKKVHLVFHPGHPPPDVAGDQSQLRQVVLNLLTNASQAIGNASGQIVIRTGKVFCTKDDLAAFTLPMGPGGAPSLPEATYSFIEVEDTGCGMDETSVAKLFDPFYTTQKTDRGLGMAAVLGIVRRHKGAITVSSTPGAGTQIRVLLPPTPPHVEEQMRPEEPPAARPTPQKGGLVLIADDEESVRSISQRMVQKLGFSVITACDGEEAVALYETHQKEISCVILDLTMPGLSGTEALGHIREINPSVKAIITSGYGSAPVEDARQAPDAYLYFLKKPYHMAELRQMLEEVIGPAQK